MKNSILMLQLDNYYDRTVRPEYNYVDDRGYAMYLENDTYREISVNFNPNDGISTSVVLGCYEHNLGNYVVILDEDNNIVSRWFVIEAIRIREKQYKVILRRDVIMDFWEKIITMPAFIEKASLDFDDPLIFNNENMGLNQIKTSEKLLKDETNCPWLVAYIAKDATQGLSGTVKVNQGIEDKAIPINANIDTWLSQNEKFYGDYKNPLYKIYTADKSYYFQSNGNTGNTSMKGKGHKRSSSLYTKNVSWNFSFENAIENGFDFVGVENIKYLIPAYTPERHTESELNEYLSWDGQTIIDIDGRIFKIKISEGKEETFTYNITSGSLFNSLSQVIENAKTKNLFGQTVKVFDGYPNDQTFQFVSTYNSYTLSVEELFDIEVNYNISATRRTTTDAPYDIIAIPYGKVFTDYGLGAYPGTNADIGLATIQAIAKNMAAGCYDIQLLPYCPVRDLIEDGNSMSVSSESQYSKIMKGEDVVGIIFYANKANFSFDLIESIPCATDAIHRKINNDCDKWRIASPNYSNYFEFNNEKNGGIQYFNVDCSYKPHNPYIHVNPNFNGLYGQDFNDPRGLVCGGEFSLSQVGSAWENYELQNKNFQKTFDRQIQNMEFNNSIQEKMDIAGAIAGTLTGSGSGAVTGFMSSGSPFGAIAGGAAGMIASGVGGFADIQYGKQTRAEALDYTKDLFGYQLGNIKAIPLTLSKISAFNTNNKVFPVLEYYTCTEREKVSFANKIAFNGMSVMTIGKISEYLNSPWEIEIGSEKIKSLSYIKCKIIKTNSGDDFHIINEIASELNKGIFIKYDYWEGEDLE